MSKREIPFSVHSWGVRNLRNGEVVSWEEEVSNGTIFREICVRTDEEFEQALSEFCEKTRQARKEQQKIEAHRNNEERVVW